MFFLLLRLILQTMFDLYMFPFDLFFKPCLILQTMFDLYMFPFYCPAIDPYMFDQLVLLQVVEVAWLGLNGQTWVSWILVSWMMLVEV